MPTFTTPKPVALTVEVLSGDVTVIASDRVDSVVEVRPADVTKKGDVLAAEQTKVAFVDGVLTVRTPKQWRTYTPFGGNPSIVVRVEVPNGSLLKASAAVGRLLVVGELRQSDLEVAAGDITVERPGDTVTAKVAKGDVRVGDAVRGVLRLETSMGELEVGIRPGSAARLEVDAKSGTVQNHLGAVHGPATDEDTVQVFARNIFGNVIVRHAVAA
ncbi:hypothetical protein [Nocardia brasiliensis]|uniref:hypothetical protein n=1 Tax=Nocardia brasiliensis TaxID=37326 RepID=UPI0024542043|nr:hypothetical protein [Nocardia brasiliensis]